MKEADMIFSKPHEECGLFGVFDRGDAGDIAHLCYYGLYALQHRGQESCGITVNNGGVITGYSDVGLVGDVFTKERIESLGHGQIALGHVRYGTSGTCRRSDSQPIIINHIKGMMALAHNGSLTNAVELRKAQELSGGIFHTSTDAEVIAYAITRERLYTNSIEEAVERAMMRLAGAYSLVIVSPRKLIAARDPAGFRPLCIGHLGNSTIIASESCALSAVGATFDRDVEPGEVIVVTDEGVRSIRTHCGRPSGLCVFEYVYFSRPDSVVDGCPVHIARQQAGMLLAKEHPVEADVVIGVPDSGLDAAQGYAQASGIPYDIGLIKNKYIGRTFIAPDQKQRENSVRIKLNPIPSTVKGKRVVMVDDSIVRGTTSLKIINLLREAGAKEVHMRLSCPPFLYPCYFGTDIDSREKLIAYKHSVDEIRQIIGADSLGYLSIESLSKIAVGCKRGLCDGCFTGNYPVPPPEHLQEK